MAAELLLRDGTRAIMWSLLKGDREELAKRYEMLDAESRYHRFLSAVPRLNEAMLERLVDDVDGIDHVALVLFVFAQEDVAVPAAIGRIVRYDDRPDTADLAVTVRGKYRGRGIGSALVQELVRERPRGVSRVLTEVAADNAPSLAMLRHLGKLTVTPVGDSILEVFVELAVVDELETSAGVADR